MMKPLLAMSVGMVCLSASILGAQARQAPKQTVASNGFKIIVIAGEGAVNVIQQKTAVAPVVEIRDRNNLPVAGVPVTFSVGASGATFGGAPTLTVATNALGQAAASGFTPTLAGAVQVNAAATFQGVTASATITQTNVLTAAQIAAVGGGGLSLTTIGIVGAAVAGSAVAAKETGILGGQGENSYVGISGTVFATVGFGQGGSSNFANPVSGATVSTTIDSTTATTDIQGRFVIRTMVLHKDFDGCRSFTLTITATGLPTYSVTGAWGTGSAEGAGLYSQQIALSPPTPNSVGCNGR